MTYSSNGPDPAEAAFVLVLVGAAIGSFSLLWVGRVMRDLRRGRQEEWLMRERMARWRRAAESAAASGVAAPGDVAGGGPPR